MGWCGIAKRKEFTHASFLGNKKNVEAELGSLRHNEAAVRAAPRQHGTATAGSSYDYNYSYYSYSSQSPCRQSGSERAYGRRQRNSKDPSGVDRVRCLAQRPRRQHHPQEAPQHHSRQALSAGSRSGASCDARQRSRSRAPAPRRSMEELKEALHARLNSLPSAPPPPPPPPQRDSQVHEHRNIPRSAPVSGTRRCVSPHQSQHWGTQIRKRRRSAPDAVPLSGGTFATTSGRIQKEKKDPRSYPAPSQPAMREGAGKCMQHSQGDGCDRQASSSRALPLPSPSHSRISQHGSVGPLISRTHAKAEKEAESATMHGIAKPLLPAEPVFTAPSPSHSALASFPEIGALELSTHDGRPMLVIRCNNNIKCNIGIHLGQCVFDEFSREELKNKSKWKEERVHYYVREHPRLGVVAVGALGGNQTTRYRMMGLAVAIIAAEVDYSFEVDVKNCLEDEQRFEVFRGLVSRWRELLVQTATAEQNAQPPPPPTPPPNTVVCTVRPSPPTDTVVCRAYCAHSDHEWPRGDCKVQVCEQNIINDGDVIHKIIAVMSMMDSTLFGYDMSGWQECQSRMYAHAETFEWRHMNTSGKFRGVEARCKLCSAKCCIEWNKYSTPDNMRTSRDTWLKFFGVCRPPDALPRV